MTNTSEKKYLIDDETPLSEIPYKTPVYFVMETEVTKSGEYIALIAEKGVPGFSRTDWYWGKDWEKACLIADDMNAGLGVSPKAAARIQMTTMRVLR